MILKRPPFDAAFGRSMLGAATASAGRTLINIPGTENTWTVPQTTKISASNYVFKSIEPESSDTYSKNFNFVASSFNNSDGTKNFVYRQGPNVANGGVPADASRPVLCDEWEQDYVITPGVRVVERHMVFTPVGGSIQRFLTFVGRTDAAPSSSAHNSLGFSVDRLHQTNRDLSLEYWRCDAAGGFAVKNIAEGFKVEMTAAGRGILLSAPNNATGNLLELAYNSATHSSVNAYAEWTFAPSGKTGSSGQSAFFDIRGRSETASTLIVRDSNGGERINVLSSGTQLNLSPSSECFVSSQLSVLNGTRQFTVTAAGQIRINQRTARTALASPGTVTGSVELFDTTGASIGSFPLYANGSFS